MQGALSSYIKIPICLAGALIQDGIVASGPRRTFTRELDLELKNSTRLIGVGLDMLIE